MKTLALGLLLIAAVAIADEPPATTADTNKPEQRELRIIKPEAIKPEAAAPRAAESSRRYYICPKDETMVRVGRAPRPAGELLCPIDGTPMKAGTGPTSSIFLLQ